MRCGSRSQQWLDCPSWRPSLQTCLRKRKVCAAAAYKMRKAWAGPHPSTRFLSHCPGLPCPAADASPVASLLCPDPALLQVRPLPCSPHPHRLHRLELVDLPVMLQWLVHGVKSLVQPATREKIQVGAGQSATLRRWVWACQPQQMGGCLPPAARQPCKHSNPWEAARHRTHVPCTLCRWSTGTPLPIRPLRLPSGPKCSCPTASASVPGPSRHTSVQIPLPRLEADSQDACLRSRQRQTNAKSPHACTMNGPICCARSPKALSM